MRRGGDENQMPIRIFGEIDQQLVPLMPRTFLLCVTGAGVGLVDDDQFWAGAKKVCPVTVALDEVDRNNRVVMQLKD